FFFQAEDGIRDDLVTGVQTCALPIFVEEDQLTEVYFERENEYTLAGSIYKGRVTRVLPGMQSAFVNIGLERDAFLYVSDFLLDEIGRASCRERVWSGVEDGGSHRSIG